MERAIDTVHRLWPERLRRVEAGSDRGVVVILPVIQLGRSLAACENLSGFRAVLDRAKRDEKSAGAELAFAARLTRVGLAASLEPPLDGKVLDTLIEHDDQRIYCEVIRPQMSDAARDAYAQIDQLAASILSRYVGRRVEVLLLVDALTPEISAVILDEIGQVRRPSDIHPIDGVALISVGSALHDLNVGPTIPKDEATRTIGIGRLRQHGGTRTSATIRIPFTDRRVKKLLSHESPHFSRDTANLLVADCNTYSGGARTWVSLVQQCMQPSRNRRFGAVILQSATFNTITLRIEETWAAVRNPHALKPIPENLIARIVGDSA